MSKALDRNIENNENKVKTLSKRIEILEEQTERLLSSLGINKETLEEYLHSNDRSEEEKVVIEGIKEKWDTKIKEELSEVDSTERKKKVFQELRDANNWIRMR